MNRKRIITIVSGAISLIILFLVLISGLVKKYSPNKDIMPIEERYKVEEGEVLIILQDEIHETKGLLIDKRIYLPYETVAEYINHRFYWDGIENILTYTTPDEIIQIEAGNSSYMVTKSMIKSNVSSDYEIIKVFANKMYVEIDFVEKYSDMRHEFYDKPNRLMIDYKWGEFLHTDVTKETELRTEPDIKAPILLELNANSDSLYIDTNVTPVKHFTAVMTKDGIKGYIKSKHIKEPYYEEKTSDFNAPEYTSLKRDGKINLVFHQVFNSDSSDTFESLLKATKGVTTVSPTWFSIIDNDGEISSLADKRYVSKANDLGVELWALVDDFNTDVNMNTLLSLTSSREKLANNLVEAAIEYKLNGINIDFENIPKEAAEHYIQFIREISVKCRNNGIVLSVDHYVPSAYTEYYNRDEQGEIVDYIIVMAYDEHYGGSEVAGPVASIDFVEKAVIETLEVVPKEKVIIAIPFYTRLWKEENGSISAESYAMTPASNILKDNGVEPKWDKETAHYYGEFEKDGAVYKMWQEEDESIEEKLKVIYNSDAAGIAAWKLGLEKESIWNVVTRYAN